MKRVLLTLTVVFSTSAQAQVINVRSYLPRTDRLADESKTQVVQVFEKPPVSVQQINSCLTSMCGPASSNISAYDGPIERMTKPSLTSKNMWKDKFLQPLRDLITDQKQYRVREALLMEDAVKMKSQIKADTPALFFVGFMRVAAVVQNELSQLFKVSQAGISVDKELLVKVVRSQPAERQEAIISLVKDVYVPAYQNALARLPFTSAFAHRMQQKYPSLSIREAQKIDGQTVARNAQAIAKKVGTAMGPTIIDSETEALVAQVARGEEMSAEESDRYVEYATSIDIFADLMSDEKIKIFIRAAGNYAADLASLRASNKLSQITATLKKIDVEKAVHGITEKCENTLTMSLELNTSDLRYTLAKKMLQDVKEASRNVAAGFLNGAEETVVEAVDKRIANIEFSLPDSNMERIKRVRESFQAERKSLRNSDHLNRKDAVAELQISALLASLKSEDPGDLVSDSKIVRACKELPLETVSDAALSSFGKIAVSWFSANYPEIGVGIVAHEVGHVASSLLRALEGAGYNPQGSFSKAWACVTNRNPFAQGTIADASFSTLWSEEDFADLFSSRVMKVMEAKGYPVSKNVGCGLVNDLGDSYSAQNQLQPNVNDSHSSGLLRALTIARDRNMSTPECRPLEAWIQSKGRPMTCD